MKKIALFLWSYCRQDLVRFWTLVAAMMLAGLGPFAYPVVYKNIIDIATLGMTPENLSSIYGWVWVFFLFVFIQQLGWKTFEFVVIKFQCNMLANMYRDLFVQTMKHSFRFFSDHMSGTIIKRVTRLVDTTESFLDMFFISIVRYVTTAIAIIVILYFEHPMLSICAAVWIILVFLLKKNLWRWKMKYNLEVAESQSNVSGLLSDSITNHFTTLIFGSSKYELGLFLNQVNDWKKKLSKSWLIDNIIFIVSSVLIILLQIAVIIGGVKLWSEGAISIGTFVLLVTYQGIFIEQLVQMNHIFRAVYRMAGDMIETLDILEQPHEIVDAPDAPNLDVTKQAISFADITFAYKDEAIFENFSLDVAPGEKVALVGVSGSGKSTLIKLLFRFYDLQSGAIMIDGQDVSKVSQESVRKSIGMVPQEPLLFHRTLAENIAYAHSDASQYEIEDAARKAGAHEFISKLPNGYNTLVGERGVKLSGGERQRVAIARTILEDASIFVLDEATSALDSESEKKIQKALEDVFRDKTAIVIAHRLSTIMRMDRIVVLDSGKIVEQGTHDELIAKKGGKYKELWTIQSGEFIDDISKK